MKILNEEKLKKFLRENLKSKNFNYNACLDELIMQYGNTGNSEYELSRFETKSGNPETINFEVIQENEDDFIIKF